MKHLSRYLRRKWPFLLLLLLGLYAAGSALLALARTAIYVHEAVILPGEVVDVRQFPFETPWDALSRGNLSWANETAYQPIVRFVLPDGIIITRTMPDADNVDYLVGQTVEVITHPHDPNQAHVHKWKFQWGGSCILLATGLLMAGGGWLILRRPLPPDSPRASRTPQAPRTPRSKRTAAPQSPENPVSESTPAEKPRKRAPRQKKTTEKATTSTTSPKSRRSSKKTSSSTEEAKSDVPRKPRRRKKTTTS